MTLMEHRFGLSWKWLFNIIITICLQHQWRHTVELASKPQGRRRERTSTNIHVCVHTNIHTHIHHPWVHLQFMTLWKREDFFFQKATSVPWQTHKSFDFSAIKQKSFLKPVRSLSLCSFGKCLSSWNKPAVGLDKKPMFPQCMCSAMFNQRHAMVESVLMELLLPVLPSAWCSPPGALPSVALAPPLRTSKFHPTF